MMEALACVALAMYFEARGEPVAGQLAVANVVMNRVESSRYPNTPCEVVTQSIGVSSVSIVMVSQRR